MLIRLMCVCLFWLAAGAADEMKELSRFADGLNIEGGVIPSQHLREGQIWANVGFILDRPFDNCVDLDELTQANHYPLKEASIRDYNEPQAALVQALAIRYYLLYGRELFGRPIRMAVHVHRNRSGPLHLRVIERLIETCLEDLGPDKIADRHYQILGHDVTLSHGTLRPFSEEFGDIDVILSISLFSGFHPRWISGTPALPEHFIPFDLHSLLMVRSAGFPSQNHLLKALPDMIGLQTAALIAKINQEFPSANPNKQWKATPLDAGDFKRAIILQANGMFYPKQMKTTFDVY